MTIYIDNNIAREIVVKTSQSPANETGAAMIGYRDDRGDTYVVAQVESDDTKEHPSRVEMSGNQKIKAAISWLRQFHQRPLEHVGDWHKHPGNMTVYSDGDEATLNDIINDEGDSFILGISNLYPEVHDVIPDSVMYLGWLTGVGTARVSLVAWTATRMHDGTLSITQEDIRPMYDLARKPLPWYITNYAEYQKQRDQLQHFFGHRGLQIKGLDNPGTIGLVVPVEGRTVVVFIGEDWPNQTYVDTLILDAAQKSQSQTWAECVCNQTEKMVRLERAEAHAVVTYALEALHEQKRN